MGLRLRPPAPVPGTTPSRATQDDPHEAAAGQPGCLLPPARPYPERGLWLAVILEAMGILGLPPPLDDLDEKQRWEVVAAMSVEHLGVGTELHLLDPGGGAVQLADFKVLDRTLQQSAVRPDRTCTVARNDGRLGGGDGSLAPPNRRPPLLQRDRVAEDQTTDSWTWTMMFSTFALLA
jgi:hypothetical protein